MSKVCDISIGKQENIDSLTGCTAITNPLSIANPNEEPVFFDNQQDIFLGGTSLGQEQGWIWGWNFLG